jgi:hypothetical protein
MTTESQTISADTQAQRLETAVAQIAALVREPTHAQRLRTAPGENEWHVLQVLGHCAEMIPYWLNQCRRVIQARGVQAPHFGRSLEDADRLAGVERGAMGNPDELLANLDAAAQKGAAEIRRMSDEERAQIGSSARWGEITVAQVIERLIIEHAENHLQQIREALQA